MVGKIQIVSQRIFSYWVVYKGWLACVGEEQSLITSLGLVVLHILEQIVQAEVTTFHLATTYETPLSKHDWVASGSLHREGIATENILGIEKLDATLIGSTASFTEHTLITLHEIIIEPLATGFHVVG